MRKPVISSGISQDSTAVATLILHITFDFIVKSTFATFSSEDKKTEQVD